MRSGALRRRYGHASSLCPAGSQVQALLFPTDRFTIAEAKAWASKHNWRHDDVDAKDAFVHLRQKDPKSFRRIRTIFFGGSGVKARVGWQRC